MIRNPLIEEQDPADAPMKNLLSLDRSKKIPKGKQFIMLQIINPPFCPNPSCSLNDPSVVRELRRNRRPTFYRRGTHINSNFGSIPRFSCKCCNTNFSTMTFSLNYYAKRIISMKKVNESVHTCTSIRDTARTLRCSPDCIRNRIMRLARQVIGSESSILSAIELSEDLVIDGFESYVINKFHPNNHNIAVGVNSQFVYGQSYTQLNRKGRMTDKQKKKAKELKMESPLPFTSQQQSIQLLCQQIDNLLPSPEWPVITKELEVSADPAADAMTDPAVDPTADAMTDPTVDPAADAMTDPAVESAVDPEADTVDAIAEDAPLVNRMAQSEAVIRNMTNNADEMLSSCTESTHSMKKVPSATIIKVDINSRRSLDNFQAVSDNLEKSGNDHSPELNDTFGNDEVNPNPSFDACNNYGTGNAEDYKSSQPSSVEPVFPLLTVYSDEHHAYPEPLGGLSARLTHKVINSENPRVPGNPLFPVNYIDRQIRNGLKEHIRKTICQGRNVNDQLERLKIYLFNHNFRKKYRINAPVSENNLTHAQIAGIEPNIIKRATAGYYTRRRFLCHYWHDLRWSDRLLCYRLYPNPEKKTGMYLPKYLTDFCAAPH